MTSDQMKEGIESLTYYGVGDETYYIWGLMCQLCYQCVRMGMLERAETLYYWIKEEAEYSKRWAEQEFGSLEDVYSEQGVWG